MRLESRMRNPGPHQELAAERCLAILSASNLCRLEWIKKHVGGILPRLDCIAPRSLEHFAEVVKRSHDTHRVLIAVGGDGTLNRVINWAKLDTQIMAFLPMGTGNDLARTLGAPRRQDSLLKWLWRSRARQTDLVAVNGILSHNSAGFGLDCATLKVRDSSQGLAHRSYHFAFLKALGNLQPVALQMEGDGTTGIEGDYLWVLGMNARYIGGGTQVAPNAAVDDGMMDVVLVEKMAKLRLLYYLPQVIAGKHLHLPGVKTFRCRHLVCKAEAAIEYIAADGELYFQLEKTIRFEVRPGAMLMLR